jgi:hypothetical protein
MRKLKVTIFDLSNLPVGALYLDQTKLNGTWTKELFAASADMPHHN